MAKTAKKAAPKKAAKKVATKAAAKPAAPKPIKEVLTKSGLVAHIAEASGVVAKDVRAVLASLESAVASSVHKKGAGSFTLPGLLKITAVAVPAKPKRKGINPFGHGRPVSFPGGAAARNTALPKPGRHGQFPAKPRPTALFRRCSIAGTHRVEHCVQPHLSLPGGAPPMVGMSPTHACRHDQFFPALPHYRYPDRKGWVAVQWSLHHRTGTSCPAGLDAPAGSRSPSKRAEWR